MVKNSRVFGRCIMTHATESRQTLWRHQMETSSALLAFCAGNSPVIVEYSMICAWTSDWVTNRDAGDLRRHCVHYDVNAMILVCWGNTNVIIYIYATSGKGKTILPHCIGKNAHLIKDITRVIYIQRVFKSFIKSDMIINLCSAKVYFQSNHVIEWFGMDQQSPWLFMTLVKSLAFHRAKVPYNLAS